MKFDEEEIIELPPVAHSLMSSTRHIGYSLEAAVADLVDNSVSAGATEVWIDFRDDEKRYIAIGDNGCGMTPEELTNAMQYGSADPSKARSEKDLGRYGLGMKTASMSQCRKMSVTSKKSGVVSARRWDLEYVRRHKEAVWPLIVLPESKYSGLQGFDKLEKKKSGTVVLWEDVDFGGAYDEKSFDEEMHKMEEHLALVFHRYLEGEDGIRRISIKVNGRAMKPKDPFLLNQKDGKLGRQCKATQPIGSGKNRIMLRAFILPHDKELSPAMRRALGTGQTLRRTQGFYIYRNKRLITYGHWFGLKSQGEFFKLARVKVDIPNTVDLRWSLDVKKSVAVPPKEIVTQLRAYVDSVVRQSHRAIEVQVFGRKARQEVKEPQVWDVLVQEGAVTAVRINRDHPVVKSAVSGGGLPDSLLRLLERTIPVDAIYFSRSSEQKIENESPLSIEELKDMMRGLLGMLPQGTARRQAFAAMLLSDPFVLHANELKKFEEELV